MPLLWQVRHNARRRNFPGYTGYTSYRAPKLRSYKSVSPYANWACTAHVNSTIFANDFTLGFLSTLVPVAAIAGVYLVIFLILRKSKRRFYAPRTYLGSLRE